MKKLSTLILLSVLVVAAWSCQKESEIVDYFDKPTDVVKCVNSTDFGTVLSASQMYRHFEMGGYRIASRTDPRCINFYAYVAWLVDRHNTPEDPSGGYLQHRDEMSRRQAEQSLLGRNIGELPAVEDADRKEKCRLDFRLFCETYFPEVYVLEWSDDHLRAIAKIQQAVLKGGLFALAMSRGSGKSSLTETAAIWAMLYGHREFVVIIGASESAALEILDSIKTELEVNEHLAADFPEVEPVEKLTLDPDIPAAVQLAALKYGEEYNISPELLEAVAYAESRYDPAAENAGCMGLMQISTRWHTERMSGNRIEVRTLDLSGDFDSIRLQLNQIANKYLGIAA